MPWIMGLGTLGMNLLGGLGQSQQNEMRKAEFDHAEWTRKMKVQQQNRQIAKTNAAKWMANKQIAKAANKTRAQKEYWVEYNYDNQTNEFSRSYQAANDKISASLAKGRIPEGSGTARALLRSNLEVAKKALVNKRADKDNKMITAKREQDAALSRRDFGYAEAVQFMPGELLQQSESDIMTNALFTGLVQGGMAYQEMDAMIDAAEGNN
jgi:hypothetical protein